MKYRLTLGDWESQKAGAGKVREAVFVVEQGVPIEMEWDDMDAASLHAVAYDEAGNALATGRLLPDGHIGRMAVMEHARGGGLGGAVLRALVDRAAARGDASVVLHAQTHAEVFYRRFGFEREGEIFMEAGIPHVVMRRLLRE